MEGATRGPLAAAAPSPVIGVVADPTDLDAAAEFFELFKTPWQPLVRGRRYRVVLSATEPPEDVDADVHVIFGSAERSVDRKAGVRVAGLNGPLEVDWAGSTLPIYGRVARFDVGTPLLTSRDRALGYLGSDGASFVYRLGYDLFAEVRRLLGAGQPVQYALTPTLELHIALLRHLLIDAGVPVVEVLPFPHGYEFICCLTHDVDFFGIRRHRLDRTLAGFLARASIGTAVDLVRGRRSVRDAVRNWNAVVTLPLVFLGLAPDPWQPFRDYAEVEPEGSQSTFFLVPYKGRSGVSPSGSVDATRAVSYDVDDVCSEVRAAAERGSEIAVHGIDAWRDVEAGRSEMKRLTSLTGKRSAGVRMHWLYFDQGSAQRLDEAGFDYDSTYGYNDAVGYKAGTSQVFRIPSTRNLMELPLSIMDSALLFPKRLNRTASEALGMCRQVVANATRFGGTLVVNWHDRSLAPERLWGGLYQQLVDDVRNRRPWFTTASQAVDWFRWRRSIRFENTGDSERVSITAPAARPGLPGAVVRVHRRASAATPAVGDFRLGEQGVLEVQL